ncbi:chromatin-remodeling ATPase INO80-like [Brassica napus]|uniref:chromatin-remodeling ATPase INO80-like n=1 Tax=Brassica napus TaxID=3708 RepID=UPI0006AAA2C2|nr:chromatin-remodeling ATPase INO80-like [Brassica napus]
MDASLGMDDDEFLIRQVEAVEASFGLNSQTAEGVQGSKDKDSGAAVDGVNPASGNMLQQEKQKSCALGTVVEVVENGSKKRAHVEAAEDVVCGVNPDNMHQQNCTLQEKEKSCGEGTVVENGNEDEDEGDGGNEDKDDVGNEDEDEDDEDYDYNGWHEFVGNDCERDEDDDFDGCPPKGGRGGRSGRNGYEHSVVTKVRGQGLEEANGQGLQVDLRQTNSVAI